MNRTIGPDPLDRARQQLERGQTDAAITTLVQHLGNAPDDADAHALLALCLISLKRIHAASQEAGCALAIDPESLLVLLAVASTATAQRKFGDAEQHLLRARELYPDSGAVHEHQARLYLAWGRDRQAMESALQALQLSPDDAASIALVALLELHQGRSGDAARHAREALERDPENLEALCVLGHCELAAGRIDSAREHAAWALHIDPMSSDALTLLGAIKARQSLVLGLWWRFQSWISSGSRVRAITLLIGIFMLYRIAMIVLDEGGHQQWLVPLSYAWIGFCAYTWIAPGLFWKSVRRELQQVRLKPEF